MRVQKIYKRMNGTQLTEGSSGLDLIHLQDFGNVLGPKPKDRLCFGGGNMDQFHMAHNNNKKANLLRAWARHYELNGVFVQETGINWTAMPRTGRLEEMMKMEATMRTVVAHNQHENLGWRQWGGTAAVAYGDLAVRVSETGKDTTGLGWWCFMRCKDRDDHAIWIIMVYNPIYSTQSQTQTVYSQQQQYFELKGDNANPHEAFLRDFEAALRSWRETGNKLIVFIDMNENYVTGAIDAMLHSDGLDMVETARTRHPTKPVPLTFVRGDRAGCHAVDGCYATQDLIIKKAVWSAVHKGPGDHRMPIVEVEYNNAMGENIHKIVRPPARQLTCRNKKVVRAYNSALERLFTEHKLVQKLHNVYAMSMTALSPAQERRMDSLEKLREEGMLHAESKCRRLSMGEVDWSPGVQEAKDKLEVWNMVVCFQQGRNINPGRIRRAARRNRFSFGMHTGRGDSVSTHNQTGIRENQA